MLNENGLKKRVTIYSLIAAAVCVIACGAVCVARILLSGILMWVAVVLCALLFSCGIYVLLEKLGDSLVDNGINGMVSLRDAAVKVASGELTSRIPEDDSILGEVGTAINELSDKLSENMYRYILERNRLQSILDNLSEGIIAVDTSGNITHINPALDRLLANGGRINDQTLSEIDSGRLYEDLLNAIKSGKMSSRDFKVADATLRAVVSPLKDEINITAGAIGMISDITEQERLEVTRREYVANVSHEMRTPLTAIRALVEPLKEGMVTDEETRMRYYDIMLREVTRLTRLISDLMELSRLQSGTLAIEKSRMKIDDLLYDVCERYSELAADHDLSFDVASDFSILPFVNANADRVEQLMVILLDNAIKYTEKGGLTVSTEFDENKVRISVADTGVGIDESDVKYVFDRFYKVDKAHSGKGSGLGLSIAKELCEWMGEEISVKSKKGVGTTFTFTVEVSK